MTLFGCVTLTERRKVQSLCLSEDSAKPRYYTSKFMPLFEIQKYCTGGNLLILSNRVRFLVNFTQRRKYIINRPHRMEPHTIQIPPSALQA